MEGPQWQLLVIVLMATAHCLALVDQEGSVSVTADPRDSHSRPGLPCHKISVSNIDFAFSLYRQLAVDNPSENIIFSPASISLALAMLSDGTPAAARTQLLEGLGFNLTVVPETEIQEGFQDLLLRLQSQSPQLLLTTGQHRFRGLHPMAMQDLQEAKKHIEAHVGQQTQGKIGTWMKALGKETTEVLANHILLKASWAQPFDPSTTSLKAFFVDELKAVQVPMMKQKARHRLFHDPELQCTVLQMDHAANATTFFVFPKKGTLQQLEDALQPEMLIRWDSLLQTRELDFYFPKFSISFTYSVEGMLPRMSGGGGISEQPRLNVSKVTHKAVMTVAEDGLEATAVTGLQLTPAPQAALSPSAPTSKEFSRPFLLMTFHTETGSMLFLGKIVNPLG